MRLYLSLVALALACSSCAHTIGQRNLKDRSHPERPSWLVNIPHSSHHQYFVGISGEETDLDQAKRSAMIDAFNDAIGKQGVEVSANFSKLTVNERTKITEEISTASMGTIGLEQIRLYWELWEISAGQSVEPRFRAYVLTRSRKLEPDSWKEIVFKNIIRRLDMTWHSALMPGWGQYRMKSIGKGRLFLLGFLASAGGYGTFFYFAEKKEDELSDLLQLKDQVTDFTFRENKLLRELKHYRNYKVYSYRATLVIYIANLIDAFVFGHGSSDLSINKSPRIDYSICSKKNRINLDLQVDF